MKKYSVSIIVPARDEAGTISSLVRRVPKMGESCEIVFVEGFSKDGTWEEIQKQVKSKKLKVKIRAFKQEKRKGKFAAMDLGMKMAKGEILMILDADLSTPPEHLPDFYKALTADPKAKMLVNGSRFVHPKEKGAMRYFNHLGNKFFAWAFSRILHQKITDTLCGSKAIWAKDYKRILNITKDIRENDPYGDFTLLLGAEKLGLRVVEIPIKYKARVYGKSKISIPRDGTRLMTLLAKDFLTFTFHDL